MKVRNLIITLAVIILLTVVFSPGVTAANKDAAALVTKIKGKAFVIGADSKGKPLDVLSELIVGDVLLLKKDSELKLTYYMDTHSEIVKGPCKIKMFKDTALILKGDAKNRKKLAGYKGIKTLKSLKSTSDRFGGVELRMEMNTVPIRGPRGVIADVTPLIEWIAVEGENVYELQVEDEDDKVVFYNMQKGTEVKIPDDKKLKYGKVYIWKIKALRNSQTVAENETAFKIVSKEVYDGLEKLKKETALKMKKNPDDMDPQIVLMTYCINCKLYNEALAVCNKLYEKYPKNENVLYWLDNLQYLSDGSMKMK